WAGASEKPSRKMCVVQMYLRNYERTESETKAAREFRERCQLFDYLINNGDRHGGNVMALGEHYVAIDNAFAFSGEHGGGPAFSCLNLSLFREEIERLRSSPILDFLMPLLSEDSLKRFVKHLVSLE
ncbi:hypothetical protein LCGC14_1404880, partial [marine sediment metagenome]